MRSSTAESVRRLRPLGIALCLLTHIKFNRFSLVIQSIKLQRYIIGFVLIIS